MSARTGLMFGTAKPVPLEAPRSRPASCVPGCYEVEPGVWIHEPHLGCTTIQLEAGEPARKVREVCWMCAGTKACDCIACGPTGKCVVCGSKGFTKENSNARGKN
jgi:hypothetical protein